MNKQLNCTSKKCKLGPDHLEKRGNHFVPETFLSFVTASSVKSLKL